MGRGAMSRPLCYTFLLRPLDGVAAPA